MPVGADEFRRRSQSIKHSSGALVFAPVSPETGSVRQYITGAKRGGRAREQLQKRNPCSLKRKEKKSTSFCRAVLIAPVTKIISSGQKHINIHIPAHWQGRHRLSNTTEDEDSNFRGFRVSPTSIFKGCALFFGLFF